LASEASIPASMPAIGIDAGTLHYDNIIIIIVNDDPNSQ
jgi:hypothetical protein